jgi:radical SAM domain protein
MKTDCKIVVMPPMNVAMPSPGAESVRAAVLRDNMNCDIIYHNLRLVADNLIDENCSNFVQTLPFICLYHRFVSKDTKAFEKAYSKLQSYRKETVDSVHEYIESLISNLYSLAIQIADTPIIAFSSKFHQWIASSVMAHLIKECNPAVRIYLGGQNTKAESEAMMVLCPDIDLFGWGEGEYPFCNMLSRASYTDFQGNARTITRSQINPIDDRADKYILFNELMPLQIDEFLKTRGSSKGVIIPIERSRGCCWNRCSFCFLSQGYRFRIKKNEILLREIEYYIKKYGIYQFQFLDNDVVCGNLAEFDLLLDELIKLRKKYPQLVFTMAEISPYGMSSSIVKKLAIAGFYSIQIGLETLSQKVMLKFCKKQTLEENISFIREAVKAGIKLVGLNIIINYPDEEIDDIKSNIKNLECLKDLISDGSINIHMPSLMIARYSKYMKMVEDLHLEESFTHNDYFQYIHSCNITGYNRFDVFQFSNPIIKNGNYWKIFYNKLISMCPHKIS